MISTADRRTYPADLSTAWHTRTVANAAERLVSDLENGLSSEEAARRLTQFGPNEIREQRSRSLFAIAIAQFKDFMVLVLVAAAIVSGLIGDAEDTLVILGIVVLNAAVGFVQDFRAERAMTALKQLAAQRAAVLRDGRLHTVPAAVIVPGDIVVVEAGSAVPADLRLIEAPRAKITEAALTGEAVPVEKRAETFADPMLAVADRANMAFKGTTITYGRARGIAVATGMMTELGKIAALLQSIPASQTPLQRRLTSFGRQLAVAVLAICAVVFGFGLLRGEPALLMLLTALSLAVAAIPEALPAVVTVMLAIGARTMAGRNALVRHLPAVETLGSVSWICTDKTGTLTLNEMHAVSAYLDGERRAAAALDGSDPVERRLIEAAAQCNDARRGEDGSIVGDPTEVALWRLAADKGLDKETLERTAPRVKELPFDSERKLMTTLHQDGDGFVAYTKGAPESVIPRCINKPTQGRDTLLAIAEAMARDGPRVLAVAGRRWSMLPCSEDSETIEQNLTFFGLIGLLDPPRPEAQEAVEICRSAGVTPVMITGDHPATAKAIATALGMLRPDEQVMTGQELRRLSDADLAERVDRTRVYARVDPEQKIRIVAAVQARGAFVAMTGDGVNDAPALARADIGVAMGRTGTDVAREAAALILLDDNFATIVAAVAEGRRIFDNIRKFISYVLTCNAAEIWTIFLAPFFGLPIPLLPIQILWINLVTDGLPGLALAAEPAEPDVMRRPPRPAVESIFARGMWQHILWVGLVMGGISLLTQAGAIRFGLDHWRTMVFTVLALSQMANVLAIRSERTSLFRQGLFSNLPLLGAVLLTIALQLMTIYLPALNSIFETAPLTSAELTVCLALSSLTFAIIEIEKWLARRGLIYR